MNPNLGRKRRGKCSCQGYEGKELGRKKVEASMTQAQGGIGGGGNE